MSYTHSPLNAMKGFVKCIYPDDSTALYNFQWDDGKLKSIIYQLNGRPKPLYENYTSSDFIFGSQNIFEYSNREIIVYHYDYLYKPLKDKPAISRYLLDNEGRFTELKYFDSQNIPTEFNGIHEYKWKYFDNKVGEIRYSKNGEIAPMDNWFPYQWVILSFDDDSNLISILTTDKEWGTTESAIKIEFKIDDGKIVGWVAMDTKTNKKTITTGPKVAEVRHDFDSNGYLVRTRFYNENGDRVKASWGHMGFVRTYSYQGNRLSYNFIDENDEINLASERGYSGQKFVWDEEGRFRLQSYYLTQQGDPISRSSLGYAQIQFIYDYRGREIAQVYKDAKGNIVCNDKVQSYILLEDIYKNNIQRGLCK